MKKVFILILFLCHLAALPILSQEKDFGLWTSIELEKKIIKNLELDFGLANRMQNNITQRDESFIDMGVSYRYSLFAAGFGYRFTNNFRFGRNDEYSHRLFCQLRFRPEWNRFRFDYRLRYQSQYFSLLTSETGNIPDTFIRNRLKISYNIRKSDFSPSFSYEYFYRLKQSDPSEFQRKRLTLGMDYNINKSNTIGVSYIKHETFNVINPRVSHIIGLEYKLEI
jgi:hypothetical protein